MNGFYTKKKKCVNIRIPNACACDDKNYKHIVVRGGGAGLCNVHCNFNVESQVQLVKLTLKNAGV